MKPAQRIANLPSYPFAALSRRIHELQAQGMDVIRMDIGSPDLPPADFILEALERSARDPSHHGYAGFIGIPAFRQAVVDYYRRRFGVELDATEEVLSLIGSKEGVAHIAWAFVDPGDLVLVSDPGYPTYSMGTLMAGGEAYPVPLRAENNWLPDLGAIPPQVADRAVLFWVDYPHNPTGAVAPLSFFEGLVSFARFHDILLCHDAPYCDVTFDGYTAPSLLQVDGAKEVTVEFNSLSKAYNMAGWRVGMAVGNAKAIEALALVKSNVDSGLFRPIQEAAAAALTGDQSWVSERNEVYQRRRDLIWKALDEVGMEAEKPKATLYLWPRVPEGYTSEGFCTALLEKQGVSFAPGSFWGQQGEGYLRISIVQPQERIQEAMERLRRFVRESSRQEH
ncbi:MAG: LL-diaminopimelate aminotransferase [Chloroflexota bacterium]|nr:LL-diaminopimelate aminotransferase [Chloroflexota bacterium]